MHHLRDEHLGHRRTPERRRRIRRPGHLIGEGRDGDVEPDAREALLLSVQRESVTVLVDDGSDTSRDPSRPPATTLSPSSARTISPSHPGHASFSRMSRRTTSCAGTSSITSVSRGRCTSARRRTGDIDALGPAPRSGCRCGASRRRRLAHREVAAAAPSPIPPSRPRRYPRRCEACHSRRSARPSSRPLRRWRPCPRRESFRNKSSCAKDKPSFLCARESSCASRRSSSELRATSWVTTPRTSSPRPSASSARTTSTISPRCSPAPAFVLLAFVAFATRSLLIHARARWQSLFNLDATSRSGDARMTRRLPSRRGPRALDVNPFEQHRQLVDVNLDTPRVGSHPFRESKTSRAQDACAPPCSRRASIQAISLGSCDD